MLGLTILALCIASCASVLPDQTPDLPKFGKPLNNLTISVGREAIFTCIVENLGPYKVAWLRVDTQTILTIASHVITKNHRIAVTHSGHRTWSLHIRDTRETDRGWYMCQVNTDPMSSNTGFLEVVVPPDILDYPTSTDMVAREGSNVTLRCAATGTPEPTVTWRREAGGTITLSNWHEVATIEGPELEITRVTRVHMGPYLCIASNGVPPTVSKRIVLIVHFPPMVWIENQLVGAYEGQTVTLDCHSEAYPRPITYWTKPTNEIIINEKRCKCPITGSRSITCSLTDYWDSDSTSKNDLLFSDDNYRIEASTVGYESSMKLEIKSVRPQDFGSFKCIAKNSLGETDGKIKLYRISAPSTTHRPNSRRDRKKSWKKDYNHDEKTAATKDSFLANDLDLDEDPIELHSATAPSTRHNCLTNFGMMAAAAFISRRLPT